jgi:hypothetical protein
MAVTSYQLPAPKSTFFRQLPAKADKLPTLNVRTIHPLQAMSHLESLHRQYHSARALSRHFFFCGCILMRALGIDVLERNGRVVAYDDISSLQPSLHAPHNHAVIHKGLLTSRMTRREAVGVDAVAVITTFALCIQATLGRARWRCK